MYSDHKISHRNIIILFTALGLILLILLVFLFKDSQQDVETEAGVAIEQGIRRLALQCYAVEGVYPPDLEYLEENYGLQVNRKDFYITYNAFASNIPPTVIVTPK